MGIDNKVVKSNIKGTLETRLNIFLAFYSMGADYTHLLGMSPHLFWTLDVATALYEGYLLL